MLRSDLRGGSGRMGCGFWHIWVWGDVDRTCVWIGGGVRWGEVRWGVWIGLVCGSEVGWGEVRWGEGRWGVWIGGVKRSTGEGKLTMGLCLARWSNYRDGEDRMAELGVTRSELDRCEWLDRCECSGWALFFLLLSLSLFRMWPGNGLKWKWKCKTIFGSKE